MRYIFSASGLKRLSICPQSYKFYRERQATPDTEAAIVGKAVHRAIEDGCVVPLDEDADEEETARHGLINAVVTHFARNYSKHWQNTSHEIEFYAKSTPKGFRLVNKPAEGASGVYLHGILDGLQIKPDSLTIHELKTLERGDFEARSQDFVDSVQLQIYQIIAKELQRMTGKKCNFALTILKRAIPPAVHANKCTCSRAGKEPKADCPKCYGTGAEAISAREIDTTPEQWEVVFANFPHLRTPDNLERAGEAAQRDRFGHFLFLPAAVVMDRTAEITNHIKTARKAVKRADKTNIWPKNIFACLDCPNRQQCIYGVTPEQPENPPALTLEPERVNILEVLRAVGLIAKRGRKHAKNNI